MYLSKLMPSDIDSAEAAKAVYQAALESVEPRVWMAHGDADVRIAKEALW